MTVRVEKEGRVIFVTLNRPPLNVMDISMLRELDGVMDICADDLGAAIVILRGAGERAFSAGVDIKDHTREKVPEMLEVVHAAMLKLLALPQVTLAQVQGVCLGGGCELASCCDFILAAEDSVFATPEIKVGCYPPLALARFSSLLGYRRAADLILTGRSISAMEAYSMGLISRLAPKDKLETVMAALTEELLATSGSVLRITLKGLRELSHNGFADALRRSEQIYRNELLRTDDVEEGVRAFLDKRAPRWTHR